MKAGEYLKLKKIAIDLVEERHKDQVYGKLPYTKHLQDVHDVAKRTLHLVHKDVNENTSSFLAQIYIAAYLHDILEDTNTELKELQDIFGEEIARLVFAVTNEPGQNRKERHEKTYPKILNTPGAIDLKLCDRIANVESCYDNKSKLLNMYKKEYPLFKETFYDEKYDILWKHLDLMLCGE
jgi:(p)ppGpp synthase/HD superfamily hydrolase